MGNRQVGTMGSEDIKEPVRSSKSGELVTNLCTVQGQDSSSGLECLAMALHAIFVGSWKGGNWKRREGVGH
jgi:hypothetical protein